MEKTLECLPTIHLAYLYMLNAAGRLWINVSSLMQAEQYWMWVLYYKADGSRCHGIWLAFMVEWVSSSLALTRVRSILSGKADDVDGFGSPCALTSRPVLTPRCFHSQAAMLAVSSGCRHWSTNVKCARLGLKWKMSNWIRSLEFGYEAICCFTLMIWTIVLRCHTPDLIRVGP